MKNTMKLAVLVAAGFGLGLPASAADKAAEVPAALKGKLVENKDGKIQDAEIPADLDYYVLYHSASW